MQSTFYKVSAQINSKQSEKIDSVKVLIKDTDRDDDYLDSRESKRIKIFNKPILKPQPILKTNELKFNISGGVNPTNLGNVSRDSMALKASKSMTNLQDVREKRPLSKKHIKN